MPRRPRIDPVGGIHHVFNRGVNRRRVFFADADRVEFGRLLGEAHSHFGVTTLAYCLLDNHYHLLLRCPEGGLSESMQRLGAIYTRHTNERLDRDGPLFRGRFASIPVLDEDYLLTVTRYIHRNALAIDRIRSVDQYRWSSHRAYLGLRRCPDFLDPAVVLDHFAGDRDRFHRFVEADVRPRWRPIGAAEVRSLVARAAADALFDDPDSASRRIERTIALGVIADLPDDVAGCLRTELGEPSRRAEQRARKAILDDPSLHRRVDEVLGELGLRPAATLGV